MRRILGVLVLLSGIVSARADEFLPCSHNRLINEHHSEFRDERVRGIVSAFVSRATRPEFHISHSQVEVCVYDKFLPSLVITKTERGPEYKLLFPPYMARLSEMEIVGIVAHEIGHIPHLASTATHILLEEITDRQAAKWVGAETVTVGLYALMRHLEWFPEHDQPRVAEELTHRIRKLRELTVSRR